MSLSLEEKFLNPYGGQRSLHLSQSQTPDHVSGATRLLENRRQMFEVQEALSTQKEEFKRREDAFKRREEGLRRKDVVLQESLVKFNKFLQVPMIVDTIFLFLSSFDVYQTNVYPRKMRRRRTEH
jgi:Domain of unknown function (DUF4200)